MAGFVKICGMNDTRAVEAALAAGADALGFVFARSVRRVTPEQAAALARPARGRALCVAVTQQPSPELLELVFELFRPDVLQTDSRDLAHITLPSNVVALAGAAWRAPPGRHRLRCARTSVLFEGPRSGTGKVADWSAAARARDALPPDPRRRVVAGQCAAGHRGGALPMASMYRVEWKRRRAANPRC